VFVNGDVLLAWPNCFPPGINDVRTDLDRYSSKKSCITHNTIFTRIRGLKTEKAAKVKNNKFRISKEVLSLLTYSKTYTKIKPYLNLLLPLSFLSKKK
jgi:hypothetical protein